MTSSKNSPRGRTTSPLTANVEIVVDPKTGEVRQAGTDRAGDFINDFRELAERDLFTFAKFVTGAELLYKPLHKPFCEFLTTIPPYRKLSLLPRGHYKTTILKAMVIHMLIQQDGRNIYFKDGIGGLGHSMGTSTRILLTSKTASLARDTLGEIMMILESNQLIRGLWPHCIWQFPRKEARAWNAERIYLPRRDIFKEASIETNGVGGQSTGYHFNVLLFDDLIDEEAANSPVVMQSVIDWVRTSRALMDDPERSLEYMNGTRWAVSDLYEWRMQNDPSIEIYIRKAIESGEPILPDRFSPKVIEDLRREYGNMFPLLMMNEAADPSLVDFDMNLVRYFSVDGRDLIFDESPFDLALHEKRETARSVLSKRQTGRTLRPDQEPNLWDVLEARKEYLGKIHTN